MFGLFKKRKLTDWKRIAKKLIAANHIGIRIEFRGEGDYVIVEDQNCGQCRFLIPSGEDWHMPKRCQEHSESFPSMGAALGAVDDRLVARIEPTLLARYEKLHNARGYVHLYQR